MGALRTSKSMWLIIETKDTAFFRALLLPNSEVSGEK